MEFALQFSFWSINTQDDALSRTNIPMWEHINHRLKLTRANYVESSRSVMSGFFLFEMSEKLWPPGLSAYQGDNGLIWKDEIPYRPGLNLNLGEVESPNEHTNFKTGYLRLSDVKKEHGPLWYVKRFNEIAGAPEVTLNLKLEVGEKDSVTDSFVLTASDLPVKSEDEQEYVEYFFDIPSTEDYPWSGEDVEIEDIEDKLEVTVTVSDAALNWIHKEFYVKNGMAPFKDLNPDSGDMIIVTGDQEIVRCHKKVLIAIGGPILKAMLESSVVTGCLQMPDVTGTTVKAWLAYLYTGDITLPLSSSEIAYQFIVAADNYKLGEVQVLLNGIILNKKKEWCSKEVADKLFFFARGKDERRFGSMEEKALAVIKFHEARTGKDNSAFMRTDNVPGGTRVQENGREDELSPL